MASGVGSVPSVPWDPTPTDLDSLNITQRQALLEHSVETFWLFINATVVMWMQVRSWPLLHAGRCMAAVAVRSRSRSTPQCVRRAFANVRLCSSNAPSQAVVRTS
jgi:hypothetical protein